MSFNKIIHWSVKKQPQSISLFVNIRNDTCLVETQFCVRSQFWFWLSVASKTCDTCIEKITGNKDNIFDSLTKLKIATVERSVFFLVCNLTLWRCFVAS